MDSIPPRVLVAPLNLAAVPAPAARATAPAPAPQQAAQLNGGQTSNQPNNDQPNEASLPPTSPADAPHTPETAKFQKGHRRSDTMLNGRVPEADGFIGVSLLMPCMGTMLTFHRYMSMLPSQTLAPT